MASKSANPDSSQSTQREAGDDDWIQVGRVLRPHGVRGEIKVEIESDVAQRFAKGSKLWLVAKGGGRRSVEIDRSSLAGSSSRIGFKGFTTREQAEEIRGAVLQVESSQVPPAPEGFFYHFDLIGCQCVDRQLGLLGTVDDVLDDGGGSLLQVQHTSGTLLIPFVDALLVAVEPQDQRIEVDLPEGLIEVCTSKS